MTERREHEMGVRGSSGLWKSMKSSQDEKIS